MAVRLAAGCAALALTFSLAPATAASAPTPAQTYNAAAFKATNAQRTENHRSVFKHKACLKRQAQKRAAKLARTHQLVHDSLNPLTRACGNGWVGENIAEGYATGAAVVTAWMHSPDHRANILNRRFTHMEVAAVQSDGKWWVSQVFWGAP